MRTRISTRRYTQTERERERGEREKVNRARIYVYKHGWYGNMELKRVSSVVVRARGTKADRGWPVLDRWIAATAKDTQSRCSASSLDHSHLFGACVALPLYSAPSTKRSRRRHASMRTPIVAESPLGYRSPFFFFLFFFEMEFRIPEICCKLLSFRD